ncbi:MAG TPA: hypothetical protein VGU01_03425 [Sphingomicrobium sp.]|nr:hypothetical protein [Sphingomicrobium sp.]
MLRPFNADSVHKLLYARLGENGLVLKDYTTSFPKYDPRIETIADELNLLSFRYFVWKDPRTQRELDNAETLEWHFEEISKLLSPVRNFYSPLAEPKNSSDRDSAARRADAWFQQEMEAKIAIIDRLGACIEDAKRARIAYRGIRWILEAPFGEMKDVALEIKSIFERVVTKEFGGNHSSMLRFVQIVAPILTDGRERPTFNKVLEWFRVRPHKDISKRTPKSKKGPRTQPQRAGKRSPYLP